jgi:hypothetical protein
MPFQRQFQNDPLPHWFSHIFRLLRKHQTYRESQSYCHTGNKLAYAKWQIGQRAFLFDPDQKVHIISTYPETYTVSLMDSSDPGQHIPGKCSELFPTRSNLKGGCSHTHKNFFIATTIVLVWSHQTALTIYDQLGILMRQRALLSEYHLHCIHHKMGIHIGHTFYQETG